MFGSGNTVASTNALVVGNNSQVSGAGAVAIGNSVVVQGANAVAVGNGTNANFSNSAAFGNGAAATRANQQSFGTAANTYTMAGVTSAASRSAQSGPTQIVTADAAGNLATTTTAALGLATGADIGAINSQLASINGQINDLYGRTSKAYTGVAMAFAMAGVPTLLPSEKFAATMNWGTFSGANGLALNAAMRITDNVQVTGGVGYGVDSNTVGARAGLRFGF